MQCNSCELAVRQDSQMLDKTWTWSQIKKMKPVQTQEMFMQQSLELKHVHCHLFSSCLNRWWYTCFVFQAGLLSNTNALHTKQQIGYASCPCELMHKCINALMLGCLKLNVHFYPVQSKSGPTELLEEIETALCGVVLGGWHCMLWAIIESTVSNWAGQWSHRSRDDDSLVGSNAGQTRSKADVQIGQRLELFHSLLCNEQRKMRHWAHSHIGQVEHAKTKHVTLFIVSIKSDSCYSTNAL
jgi:hypothetical protein